MIRPLKKFAFEGGCIIANTGRIIFNAEENCVNVKVCTALF